MKLLILTGMSGAGKHAAFKALEDIGYNCVDNLPVELLKSFVDLAARKPEEMNLVAVGIDVRSGDDIDHMQEILDELENDGKSVHILFVDADDEVLLRRFKETRRTPPLAQGERISEGIQREREKMAFLREKADYVIDTSRMLTKDLRAELSRIFAENGVYHSLNITVLSFGYKYGIPEDADLVFDVRFLPNPYYLEELRPKTGNDAIIREYVMKGKVGPKFVKRLFSLIDFLIPQYIAEGKNQLVICFGCTGGKHRSVTIANEIYNRLSLRQEYGLRIEHRDIDKDVKRGK